MDVLPAHPSSLKGHALRRPSDLLLHQTGCRSNHFDYRAEQYYSAELLARFSADLHHPRPICQYAKCILMQPRSAEHNQQLLRSSSIASTRLPLSKTKAPTPKNGEQVTGKLTFNPETLSEKHPAFQCENVTPYLVVC